MLSTSWYKWRDLPNGTQPAGVPPEASPVGRPDPPPRPIDARELFAAQQRETQAMLLAIVGAGDSADLKAFLKRKLTRLLDDAQLKIDQFRLHVTMSNDPDLAEILATRQSLQLELLRVQVDYGHLLPVAVLLDLVVQCGDLTGRLEAYALFLGAKLS